jgi:hypothetical protein
MMGSFSSKDKRTSIRVVQVKETTLEIQGTRLSPKAKKSTRTTVKHGGHTSNSHEVVEAAPQPRETEREYDLEDMNGKSVEAELIMNNALESQRRESIDVPNGGLVDEGQSLKVSVLHPINICPHAILLKQNSALACTPIRHLQNNVQPHTIPPRPRGVM